jgi:hypothetical protein
MTIWNTPSIQISESLSMLLYRYICLILSHVRFSFFSFLQCFWKWLSNQKNVYNNILVHVTEMHSVLKLFFFGSVEGKRANPLELLRMKLVDFLGHCTKCEGKTLSFPDSCQICTNFYAVYFNSELLECHLLFRSCNARAPLIFPVFCSAAYCDGVM